MSKTDAAKEWGALLRRAREEARLSQEELAHGLGCAAATISRWETGKSAPRNFEALDISRLLYNATRRINPIAQTEPAELAEVIEQIRFFWRLSGNKGEGPTWRYLKDQLEWMWDATRMGIPVDRRTGTPADRKRKSA